MKTRVHVNQHNIKANRAMASAGMYPLMPVFSVKQGGKIIYTDEVEFTGPTKLVYRPDKPLSCGATAWMETDHPVIAIQK